MIDLQNDIRFKGIVPFNKKIWLSSPTLLIEDAAESFGASYKGIQTGCFGDISIISFNGNNVFKTEGNVDFYNKELNNTGFAA